MAVFLSNICTFNSCGSKFASLPELIRHIEDHHLDVDIEPIEKPNQIQCLPVSCILRIFSSQGDDLNSIDSNTLTESHHHARKSVNSPAASLSTTPTEGSELDEDAGFESDSGQSSIDSWANIDSSTNQLIKFHQIMGSSVSSPTVETMSNNKLLMNGKNGLEEKRLYFCNVAGCNKQYRTSNSLSHHRRSAHKDKVLGGTPTPGNGGIKTPTTKPTIDESNKKIYKCFCGKIYKTSHGLKSHCNSHHNNQQQILNVSQQTQQENETSNMATIIQQPNPNSSHVNSFIQVNNATNSTSTLSPSINPKTVSTIFNNTEIITDQNCPPVSVNVEVTSEPKHHHQAATTSSFLAKTSSPPIISAPTLQQHLLSPVIPKVSSN